jgi:hypothetical protein
VSNWIARKPLPQEARSRVRYRLRRLIEDGATEMSDKQKQKKTYLFVTIGARTERGGSASRVSTQAEARGVTVRKGETTLGLFDPGYASLLLDATNGENVNA